MHSVDLISINTQQNIKSGQSSKIHKKRVARIAISSDPKTTGESQQSKAKYERDNGNRSSRVLARRDCSAPGSTDAKTDHHCKGIVRNNIG